MFTAMEPMAPAASRGHLEAFVSRCDDAAKIQASRRASFGQVGLLSAG
jgi:hypothetical protein